MFEMREEVCAPWAKEGRRSRATLPDSHMQTPTVLRREVGIAGCDARALLRRPEKNKEEELEEQNESTCY